MVVSQGMLERPFSFFKAPSIRIRIFLNPQTFLYGFNFSTSTRIRIQIKFGRPHVSGFTLS